jgi:hypothetical protein
MNPDHIEKLKREYTDKYVAVDGSRPELARFKDVVGQVRTVNMSGRALVEFLDYHINIGWYDIDVDYLRLVEKPEPKAKEAAKAKDAAKKPAAKPAAKADAPAAEKKLSPLEMARAMDANKKAGGAAPAKPVAGKMSTADVLAAARGAQTAKAEATAEKPKPSADPKKMSTADILAAARGAKAEAAPMSQAPPAAKPQPAAEVKPPVEKPKADRSKLSTADILAMARGEKASAKASAADTAEVPAAVAPASAVPTQSRDDTPAAVPPPAKSSSERVDRTKMSVDEMIVWCRAHDSK